MFGRKQEGLDVDLLDRVESLTVELVKLEAQIEGSRQALELADQAAELREEISRLNIQRSEIEEKHARERREIDHKLGLQRARQEQELELGIREAQLQAKEENLAADQRRFEESVKFIKDETANQRKLLEEVLKRLPTVTINGGLTASSE